jgi:hypothetical protein
MGRGGCGSFVIQWVWTSVLPASKHILGFSVWRWGMSVFKLPLGIHLPVGGRGCGSRGSEDLDSDPSDWPGH